MNQDIEHGVSFFSKTFLLYLTLNFSWKVFFFSIIELHIFFLIIELWKQKHIILCYVTFRWRLRKTGWVHGMTKGSLFYRIEWILGSLSLWFLDFGHINAWIVLPQLYINEFQAILSTLGPNQCHSYFFFCYITFWLVSYFLYCIVLYILWVGISIINFLLIFHCVFKTLYILHNSIFDYPFFIYIL
jgi:hypothetical protein